MLEGAPEEARRLFALGYQAQMEQRLQDAVELYKQSITVYPTAEAHTFLGWVYSWEQRLDDAIAECHAAIRVDPAFGNPYNDIGAYLIALGRLDEAVEWLERAKQAPRYEPRHFPYFNLARIYVSQHKVREAIRELEVAVRLEPGYVAARRELHRLLGMLN
jgi:tetratricopeptide (TPR) repeat protein